jgi:hypothetical protein
METNKVFELVEFFYNKKAELANHYDVVNRCVSLRNEAYDLKPKSPLYDDTAYKAKTKELREYGEGSHINDYIDSICGKITEFGFVTQCGTYKNQIQDVIDGWLKDITDREEARDQLIECKRQFNELKSEKVWFVLMWIDAILFDDLEYILKETFDNHLVKKYKALSTDLAPFLERFDADVIESIIDYKRLPAGAEKPIWKRQAYAHIFGDRLNIEVRNMNEMFLFRNGNGKIIDKLKHNTKSKNTNSKLADILSKYSF